MRACDLAGKNVVIWGTGREGRAAAELLQKQNPKPSITFVDEAKNPEEHNFPAVRAPQAIAAALESADAIIKSPGVSLYHPLIEKSKSRGTPVTSLLNLWLAEPHTAKVICITGTKGKSTTASLLAHTLKSLGKRTSLAGNIGVPVTETSPNVDDFIVVEVSSYQAADLRENCDIGVLTSLYPEHLDWHLSLENYFRDKLNLIKHSHVKIVNFDAKDSLQKFSKEEIVFFNYEKNFHTKNNQIYCGDESIGKLNNRHLSKPYNLSNVCAVLTVIEQLGLNARKTLPLMENFQGLPHRQQELGEKNGVLFVNDSISTTPQSAIAALESYAEKPVTLIAGGFDRGIDYAPLVEHIISNNINAVICTGESGKRIFNMLENGGYKNAHLADSMKEIVEMAKNLTPKGGVVLLSPAAPSYGMFKNFEERGFAFAKESGFPEQ